MRRCPYCAEDIADDVTRCPHCGSDLGTAAAQATTAPGQQPAPTVSVPAPAAGMAPAGGSWGTPQAQPAPAPGSVQFSHTGHRYLLGYDATDFGIWDRTAPGGPVERFPRSDAGWSRAWQRYASLEPNNQPVQAAAAAPGPYGAPAAAGAWGQPQYGAYQPVQPRATNGMAVASLVLGLVGLVTFWLLAIPPILALVFGLVGRSQIKISGGRQEGDGLAIAGIVTGIVGMVIFVIVLIVNINTNTRF